MGIVPHDLTLLLLQPHAGKGAELTQVALDPFVYDVARRGSERQIDPIGVTVEYFSSA